MQLDKNIFNKTIMNFLEEQDKEIFAAVMGETKRQNAVSYTHLRAHETVLDIVCRLLLEKKK